MLQYNATPLVNKEVKSLTVIDLWWQSHHLRGNLEKCAYLNQALPDDRQDLLDTAERLADVWQKIITFVESLPRAETLREEDQAPF
jgi:hypothetical protein